MEIDDETNVVDGNRVIVAPHIRNASTQPQTFDVRLVNDDSGEQFAPDVLGETLGAGETTDSIVFNLDTTSLAWDEDGFAQKLHRFKVVLRQSNHDVHVRSREINIVPMPVVFVHGWRSDWTTWSAYLPPPGHSSGGILQSVSPDWRGFAVGDGQAPGIMDTRPFGESNTIAENAVELAKYIKGVRTRMHAAQLDVVAHSMGGLITREYLQERMPRAGTTDLRPVVSRVVMLGTPNSGSPCAFETLPGASWATKQLSISYMQRTFNNWVTQERGVSIGVLGGINHPLVCSVGWMIDPNGLQADGVVTTASAFNKVAMPSGFVVPYHDVATLSISHLDMTSSNGLFSYFIEPRLKRATQSGLSAQQLTVASAVQQAAVPGGDEESLILSKAVDIGPMETIEVPFTVPAGESLELMVIADPSIGLDLVDASGQPLTVQGSSYISDTAKVSAFHVDLPAPGVWHLSLNNSTVQAHYVALNGSVIDGPVSLSVELGSIDEVGAFTIRATLTSLEGGGVVGADVIAKVDGNGSTSGPLTLQDDGLHGDDAPSDGVYGGSSGSLAPGLYSVLVEASVEDVTVYGGAMIGEPPAPSGCTTDADCDDVMDVLDNCPSRANAWQEDGDDDLLGTACEASVYGTDVANPDSDGDGCRDGAEVRLAPDSGGDRSPLDGWDFFDITGDAAIDLTDAVAILQRFGAGPAAEEYDARFDRIAPDPAKRYKTAPAVGAAIGIDVSDVLLNLQSFGHHC